MDASSSHYVPRLAIQLLEMGVSTGVTSLTITRTRPLRPIRDWIADKSNWWGELVRCPYCVSHWVALGLALWPWPGTRQAFFNWLITVAIAMPVAAIVYRAVITIHPPYSEMPNVPEAEPEIERQAA